MMNFRPIFKREVKVYFGSPIAYAVIFMFLLINGFMFAFSAVNPYLRYSGEMMRNPAGADLNYVDHLLMNIFGQISVILLFMLPILTMRLFAEEKKAGTFELLLSYPVRDLDIVIGKYLSAMFMVGLMLALTGVSQVMLWMVDVREPGVVFSGYLGLLLEAAAFISLGLFLSSLTENQVIAAVLGFGSLLLIWIVQLAASGAASPWREILEHISLVAPMQDFARGVVDTRHIAYYLSFIFFFLFLTLRSLESRKWRG
jgi:ABC-2 type transport system permease protein